MKQQNSIQSFSLLSLLQTVWGTFQYYSAVIVGIFGIWGLVSYLPALLIFFLEPDPSKPTVVSLFLILLFVPIQIIIKFGFIKISLRMQDRQSVKVVDIFSLASIVYKYILGWLLYACIVTVGFFLLIVPGVIWAVRFNFFGFILAENPDMKIFDALRNSYLMTAGSTRTLVKFWLFFVVLEIASFMIIVIGPLLASLIIMLSLARLFRMLQAKKSLLAD